MYAIVEINGKQYKVQKDIVIHVDKLKEKSEKVVFDKVLMFFDGENVILGKPYLENVKITAETKGQVKGKKVRGIKFKKRKNYTRMLGHRHEFTILKINDLAVK